MLPVGIVKSRAPANNTRMMEILCYTGGLAETNAYLIKSQAGWLAVDAPEGFLDFMQQRGVTPTQLVLTHGHWDHIWDAAEIAKTYSCPVFYHQADETLCTRPEQMRSFGLPIKLNPVQATRFLAQGDTFEHGQWSFQVLHIPGHCPGSICLYEKTRAVAFVGDVLFAGSVGRTDLPGGSSEQLFSGIQSKLFALPDDVTAYPGHGPDTNLGVEKKTNPYVKLK